MMSRQIWARPPEVDGYCGACIRRPEFDGYCGACVRPRSLTVAWVTCIRHSEIDDFQRSLVRATVLRHSR